MLNIMAPYKFWSENPILVSEISDKFDSLVVVTSEFSKEHFPPFAQDLYHMLKINKEIDAAFDDTVSFVAISDPKYGSTNKLVHSPTGPLNRDYDDVRRFADAAVKGIKRALQAGGKSPLLIVIDSHAKFQLYDLVALLAVAQNVYVPIELREIKSGKTSKVSVLGFWSSSASPETLRIISAIESGRVLCRDIGGSDPERMAAPNVGLYIMEMFADSPIKVEIVKDNSVFKEEYPLLYLVNRAAREIDRHGARIIYLTYVPEGPYDTTLVLVGKGVTYDTGGADVKAGGVMAGMHRDKCGAAAVAGFLQTVAVLKPKGIKIIGAMCMVRNSIGPDGYVADELVTSKAGVRIRVGNTDAEGRMAMADTLCHLKEKVMNEKNVYMFTIATLTGHACIAAGDGYSIIMDNGPAKAEKVGESIQKAGEEVGDMFETSTIRREDFNFNKGKSDYEDLVQSNNLPSSRTPRGHQIPAAFLIVASGLDKHGIDSNKPLKYSHIDIAASSGPFPGIPSGAPIPALTRRFLQNQ